MQLILFASLLGIIACCLGVALRHRREHRQAEKLAKALRYERWKARRARIPIVSSNLHGSIASDVNANAIKRISLTD